MQRPNKMIAATGSEYDARLLTAVRVALRKARELGYPVEGMALTASVAEGAFAVYFAPVDDPGTITTGGDLTLMVDPDTEEIRDVKRGQ